MKSPLSLKRPSLNAVMRPGTRPLSPAGDASPGGQMVAELPDHPLSDPLSGLGQTMRSSFVGPPGRPSLNRTRSDTFLSGVSTSAEYLNSMQDRSMSALGCSVRGGKHLLAPPRADGPGPPSVWRGGAEQDEQDFVRSTDRLVMSITDLRSRHEAFEAMGSPMARRRRSSLGNLPQRGQTDGDSQAEQEKAERLAERLEQYKMVRKVEGEVPQLPPLSSLPPLRRDPTDETIIKRNASTNAIQCWSPTKRKEIIHNRSEALCHRTSLAAQAREETMSAQRSHAAETLQRKRMQGERVSLIRAEPGRKAGQRQDSSGLAEQWLKICALVSSVKNLTEEVKVSRMDPEERMRYIVAVPDSAAPKKKFTRMGTLMAQAMFLTNLMADEDNCFKLQLVACVVKKKLLVGRARSNARAIFDCLTAWKVAGRCFRALRAVFRCVVKIQRWWRMCAQRLHEARDQISRRWEKLEREQLIKDLQRAPVHVPRSTKSGQKQTLEERIESEKVEDCVRLRFIENELRIRRYKTLPQIIMWEEEVAKWRRAHQEWHDTKEAHRALGKEAPAMSIFHWPPVRPTYMPPAHPLSEASGCACQLDCLGRKGDEEILNMWRAARKRHSSLTPFARRDSRTDASQPRGRRNAGGRHASIDGSSSNPFGDAADEELRRWGVSATALPGLEADGGEVPTVAPITPF